MFTTINFNIPIPALVKFNSRYLKVSTFSKISPRKLLFIKNTIILLLNCYIIAQIKQKFNGYAQV